MTEDLAIPLEALAIHTAILGMTGGGKTVTGKLAIEQVVARGSRVCILDPVKSDWWGITSSADGKSPGLPFCILGGPRGHVPLHSGAGKAIGEIVARGELKHSIVDMREFEPGGQVRFFADFAHALLQKIRGVVYLVIEEAHLFAPKERSGMGVENMAIHWAKTLATAGRSAGIRLIVMTQRVQALHNAVLGSCQTIIAHRLTAPADQEPVLKWLRANAGMEAEEVAEDLGKLPTGTGWLCATPGERHAEKASGSTPPGKMGKAERKILAAIVQFPGSSREKIGIIAGYSPSSGHFDNVLGALRSSGWVERALPLHATPEGIKALGHVERLPTGRALVDYWLGKLGKAERAMLEALVAAHPRALTREALGQASGYSPESGHFDNVLGRLRTLELASRGREIKASEYLFVRAGCG